MLIAGWKARWAAAALLGFTFLATILFHAFWAAPAQEIRGEMNNFMKNLAIMGGLLYIVAYGAGPFSVGKDGRAVEEPAAKPRKKHSER